VFLAAITSPCADARITFAIYTPSAKIANAISRDPRDFTYFATDDQSPSSLSINTRADVGYEILISENPAAAWHVIKSSR